MTDQLGINAYQCKRCGKIHYPFHDRCLNCKNREFEEITPEGDPKLLTYTQIFNLPWGFDVRYLVIGVVEFSNKIKAMGQIRVDSLDGLKIGMELKASWDTIRVNNEEKVYGLVLQPK